MSPPVLRLDTSSGERVPFANERPLRDDGRWRGARLELWREAGVELPETVLPQHAVVMTLGPTDALDVSFAGGRSQRGARQPGAVCVVPAGAPYRVRRAHGVVGPPSEMVVLGLDPAFVSSVCGTRRVELRPSFGAGDEVVLALLRALAQEARAGHPSPTVYGEALLVALAAQLGRSAAPAVGARPERVRQYIHDRLREALPLADLAAVAECDVRSFTRWFREAFGTSPHRYITAARVERAKERLASSADELGLVALDCGFSSQSHLTTVFRQHAGVTPGGFRRQFKR